MTRAIAILVQVLVVGALVSGNIVGSSGAAARPAAYVVGHLAALTGPSSPTDYGIALRNAAQLAIGDINASGGIGGIPVRGVYEDHQSNGQVAVLAMRKLVDIDKVPVVFSNDTNVTQAIAPIATENRVLVINCCARSSTLANAGPYVYTSRPYDRVEEELFMRYLSQKRYKRVAMIHNATGSGRSSRKILEDVLPKLGMQLVDVEEYPQGTSDYSSYIAKIRSSNPDVLYMNTFGTDIGSILLQVRQSGMTVPIGSFGSALDPQVLKVAGAAAEGLMISSQVNWNPDSQPQQRVFVTKYQRQFGSTPAGFAALEYDAVHDILPVLIRYTQEHNLPYTGETLKAALDAIRTFKGDLTGECAFTIAHECLKDMAVFTVAGGKFKVLAVQRAR